MIKSIPLLSIPLFSEESKPSFFLLLHRHGGAFVYFRWKKENKVEGSMAVDVSAADNDTDSPQLKTASGRCETCCWGHGCMVELHIRAIFTITLSITLP